MLWRLAATRFLGKGRLQGFSTSTVVKIVEVGPRDGLQNERTTLSVDERVKFVDLLTSSGLPVVEVGSFVSPKWIPQMANSGAVFDKIFRAPGVRYPMLVPNAKGMQDALQHDVSEIAIFGAASETFSKKNINCSIEESVIRFKDTIALLLENARKEGKLDGARAPWIRGYISCVLGCPYEGTISSSAVVNLMAKFKDLGCHEISLGDTIGVGTPGKMQQLLQDVKREFSTLDDVAVHCHDTYGQALANIWVAITEGVRIVDSSVAGLGGCPYAKGASGNVSTEDVIYMLEKSGFSTGIDSEKLGLAADYVLSLLKRPISSKVGLVRQTRRSVQ